MAALQYARRGWPVFPCRERDDSYVNAKGETKLLDAKAPYTGTGLKDATTDEAVIKGWWRRWPEAMIGLAVGADGSFVIDFDPRHDEETGEEFTLETLKAALEERIGCALPTSLAVRTPSGGVHVYLRELRDGGEPLRNRAGTKKSPFPQHVDARATGGYVILPPSRCHGGRKAAAGQYRWLHGRQDSPIEDAPAALMALMREKRRSAPSGAAQADPPQPTGAGAPSAPSFSSSSPPPPAAPSGGGASSHPASSHDEAAAIAAGRKRYAMAALDSELATVAATSQGGRNQQLYDSAMLLGTLVEAGALSRAIVEGGLQAIARGWDDYDKSEATIANGLENSKGKPRDLSAVDEASRRWFARTRSRPGGARAGPAPFAPAPHADSASASPSSHLGASGWSDQNGGGQGDRDDALTRKCAFMPMTDLGNKERFLARHGRDFRYVEQWGWLAWDGRRWNRDMAEALLAAAVHDTMRRIQDEADFIAETGVPEPAMGLMDDAQRAEHQAEQRGKLDRIVKTSRNGEVTYFSDVIAKWGRTSEGAGHIGCIAKLAQADVSAKPDQFDRDPLKINLANGTMTLAPPRDGYAAALHFGRYRRSDLITKIAEVDYDPAATCPRFDAYIGRVQPAEDMRRYLEAWAGYNMTGLANAQKLALFYGQGANGKSVWVDLHAHILGDYSRVCGIETFIDQGRYRKGSDASPDLAALAGRRMVRTSEPEEGSKFSDGLIKAMTGSEPLPVRELMKPPFEMVVNFKVTVSANIKPKIGTDHGIQRRVDLIPWDVIIPDEEQDTDLLGKLKAEASGVLNAMLRGALLYLTSGLPKPEAVKAATREYQDENDLLGQFLHLCVEKRQGSTVGATPLHELFVGWQTWAGEIGANGKPWSMKYLSAQMRKKGFAIMKSSTMLWQDIALLKARDDFVDVDGRPRHATGSASPSSAASAPPDEPVPGWDDLPP